MDNDDILDLIAQCRDQHLRQASDWQRIYEHRRQTSEDRGGWAEASGMIDRNNFAAQALAQVLVKVERKAQGGIEIIGRKLETAPTAVRNAGGKPR